MGELTEDIVKKLKICSNWIKEKKKIICTNQDLTSQCPEEFPTTTKSYIVT